MKTLLCSLIVAIGIAVPTIRLQAQDHGHLYVGADGTNQNDKLLFSNEADFIASSGYVNTLTYTNGGKYAGFYNGNITLSPFPVFSTNGGPVIGAAALGSFIKASIVSVETLSGGAFSFWETNSLTNNPTFTYTNGQAVTNLFTISAGTGAPGADPFGHIHGRRFSATKPGIYKVNFQVFDASTNGADGGPIHTPSDILPVYFQAGINIESITQMDGFSTVRFGSVLNKTFTLEATSDLGDTNSWTPVADDVEGTDYFLSVTETNTAPGQRFYRMRAVP